MWVQRFFGVGREQEDKQGKGAGRDGWAREGNYGCGEGYADEQ